MKLSTSGKYCLVCGSRLLRSIGYLVLVLLVALVTAPTQARREDHRPLPLLQGEKAWQHLKQQGLYDSLGEAMREARYGVKWAEKNKLAGNRSAFASSNPAQNFYSCFTPEAVHLADSSQAEKSWRLRLKLRSAGYGQRQRLVSEGRLKASGTRIDYERAIEGEDVRLTE